MHSKNIMSPGFQGKLHIALLRMCTAFEFFAYSMHTRNLQLLNSRNNYNQAYGILCRANIPSLRRCRSCLISESFSLAFSSAAIFSCTSSGASSSLLYPYAITPRNRNEKSRKHACKMKQQIGHSPVWLTAISTHVYHSTLHWRGGGGWEGCLASCLGIPTVKQPSCSNKPRTVTVQLYYTT